MEFSCALFDFDGVIADTEQSNMEYLAAALSAFGITLSPEERYSLVGINDPSRIEAFLSRADRKVTMEEYLRQRAILGNTYQNGNLHPMPGLVPMLRRLRETGMRTAVVSSTSSHLIAVALEQMELSDLFDVVICGDMVAHKKPDPQPYLMAMQRLGVKPEQCIVFEDSPVGIQSGKSAGAFVVGYRGSAIRQNTEQADCTLDSYEDFPEKLQANCRWPVTAP